MTNPTPAGGGRRSAAEMRDELIEIHATWIGPNSRELLTSRLDELLEEVRRETRAEPCRHAVVGDPFPEESARLQRERRGEVVS